MGQLSYTLPTLGNQNATEDPDIRNALSDLKTLVNGNIDDDNTSSSSYIEGNAQLYRTLFSTNGFLTNTFVNSSGNFWLAQANAPVKSGSSAISQAPNLFRILAADFPTLGSKVPKFRVCCVITMNATLPGAITLTPGLYPVSAAGGGAGGTSVTLGSVVTDSVIAYSSFTANSFSPNNSLEFGIPSDGTYSLGFNTTGAMAANSAITLSLALQYRYV